MEANNMTAMREALKSVAAWLLERFGNPADPDHDKAEGFYILTTGVLAAPARNCDVGTPEEQLDRYGLFCQNRCPICENRHACHICGERYRMKCMSAWAQAKYEAEGDAE